MATTFDQALQSDRDNGFLQVLEFAATVTLSDVSGNATSSVAMVPGPSFADGGRSRKRFWAKTTDVASTVPGDTVTLGSDVWEIDAIPQGDDHGMTLLETSKAETGL